MSPGNAHPYSWSAIINGQFDAAEITRVGYPAVATYLEANRDTLGLPGSRVTNVWTQDKDISASIAKTTGIDKVSSSLEEMAKEVDAVILARDDSAEHVSMSKVFFASGIPVFIDKPLASNGEDLEWFAEQERAGKMFMSCSSMRYSNECKTAKTEIASLGEVLLATCVGKKDWIKYGVHLLEGLFALLDDPKPVSVRHIGQTDRDIVHLEFEGGVQATLHLFMDITSTFQISLYGKNGWKLVDIRNSYSMFRDTIIEFLRAVVDGKSRITFGKTYNIINTLVAADESLKQGGRTIKIR